MVGSYRNDTVERSLFFSFLRVHQNKLRLLKRIPHTGKVVNVSNFDDMTREATSEATCKKMARKCYGDGFAIFRPQFCVEVRDRQYPRLSTCKTFVLEGVEMGGGGERGYS